MVFWLVIIIGGLKSSNSNKLNDISKMYCDNTYFIENINDVCINGVSLGINGYLDIGLIDTMNDLIVNFLGALFFSVFGYVYTQNKGKGKFVSQFIPFKKKKKES
mgnify:CR=1 FL=1